MAAPTLVFFNTMQHLYEIFKQCTGISTDTRTIAQGSLFVALKGENFDANTMVGEALERGAAYVVTTNAAFAGNSRAIVVDDTLATLQQLAHYHRQQLEIPIVGITGTNGKTTTKELVAAVLRRKYNVFATKGNLNNHIGVPLSLLSITDEHEMAVIEMGASHPGEIRDLAAIVCPSTGLITNVGIAHIFGFGSFEGVKQTKAELYNQIKSTRGMVFINASNDNLVQMLGDYERTFSYGTSDTECFVDGHLMEMGETLNFEWSFNGEPYRQVQTNMTGAYNLENALAAAAVGTYYGVGVGDICCAIAEYTPTNSRSQIVVTERNRVIMDAYNANPSSMTASVDNFASLSGEGKVLVLGAMRELGDVQDEMHHALMSKIAALGFDTVYLVGSEFQKFAAEFPAFRIVDNAETLASEMPTLTNRYILVKGSRSNKLEQLLPLL